MGRIFRSQVLYLVIGLCLVAFGLTRWVESAGGPSSIWERFGLIAPAISVPVHAIVAVTPFPSDVLSVANGTVYGFWLGSLFSWLGWYIAAFIEFQIGRRARTEFPIEDWVGRLPKRLRQFPVDHHLDVTFAQEERRRIVGIGSQIIWKLAGKGKAWKA